MSFARLRLACVLILTLNSGAAWAAAGDVGTPAADFDLQIFQGSGTMSLGEHSGKVVMLSIIGYG